MNCSYFQYGARENSTPKKALIASSLLVSSPHESILYELYCLSRGRMGGLKLERTLAVLTLSSWGRGLSVPSSADKECIELFLLASLVSLVTMMINMMMFT